MFPLSTSPSFIRLLNNWQLFLCCFTSSEHVIYFSSLITMMAVDVLLKYGYLSSDLKILQQFKVFSNVILII